MELSILRRFERRLWAMATVTALLFVACPNGGGGGGGGY
jgi:hypothetical protein